MIPSPDHFFKEVPSLEKRIGYHFKDKSLLLMAFTHPSFSNENKIIIQENNERLEFLGDSVLGMIIAGYLYTVLPKTDEGVLSALRSKIVEGSSCILFTEKLGVIDYLMLGKGERRNGSRGRGSIMADLFEALMGAIYLDGGLAATTHFFFSHFTEEIASLIRDPQGNWKADLQDYCQRNYQARPLYQVDAESGPDHSKRFEVTVIVNGQEKGKGQGSSKKEAEQNAAKQALEKLYHG